MIRRVFLAWLLAAPCSAAVVSRVPVIADTPGLSAPSFAPSISIQALNAPALSAPSLIPLSPAPSIAPAPSALAAVKLAAAAIPDPKAPASLAKAETAAAFDASPVRKTETAEVGGALSVPAALPAAATDDAPEAPKAVPPAPRGPSKALTRRYRIVRAIARPLVRLVYKTTLKGLENLPSGPAVIVPNHVSYMDAILISFAADRPMRFLMKKSIYDKAPRLLGALGAIPVSRLSGKKAIEASLEAAREALRRGETVVIFPEGQLTLTGGMTSFKRGFESIVAGAPAPVIPAYLDGMWGSAFSMMKGPSLWARIAKMPRPVSIRFGPALAEPTAQAARIAVGELGAQAMEDRVRSGRKPLAREFFSAAMKSWTKPAIADTLSPDLSYGRALTGALLLGRSLDALTPGETNVGVLLPPSAGGALSNIGLASAGRVPVNLNYTASTEAFETALKTAGISTIVTSKRFLEALAKDRGFVLPPGRKLVYLEDVSASIPAWKKTAVYLLLKLLPSSWTERAFLSKASRSLDDVATILFTSGSSALPKGVVLTNLNVLANVEMVREVLPWTAEPDAVLGVLPFFHSFGYTVTMWLPLVSGMSAAYHANPMQAGQIGKLAERAKATILLGTPDFLTLYSKKIAKEAFAHLRLVIAGAEKLRDSVADEFEAKFGLRPFEGYGATELSPVATAGVPDVEEQKGWKPGSPGRALPGGVIKAVDLETGKPVPDGEPGMLLFRGPNVMRGYYGEPEKTAAVVKDGWYVTGDVGTVDKDGFVTITGRLSRFSKIGGEMVSHVAVEEKLQQAAELVATAFFVTGVKDAKGREKLVVLHAGWDGDPDALLAKMRELGVPNLWLPGRGDFRKIDAIPQLGTGKLDLKAANELAAKLAGPAS